ncbi:MAG: competence protein CoiA [Ignavibacteriaceae bacterium]|nr:competence protein CoiA [Ignavibacteriaceae bacterium]
MEDTSDIVVEHKIQDEQKKDSRLARCLGLLGGTAHLKISNKKVFADDVVKTDGPFYCPVCLSEVVVRKCTEKIDHFAHHARLSPVITYKDKELHDRCSNQILEYLQKLFPDGKWERERVIPANRDKLLKKIIPDISGRINNIPIAIEVQASSYTINRISTKVIEYQKRNPKVAVLYVVPLTKQLGDEPFRPRLYEKYLHSMFGGKVYYWTINNGSSLQPVHYSPVKRWIEETTWFDTELEEERTEGGFWLTYRTIKTPNYGQCVDIAKDFIKKDRKYFEPKNVKKSIPECTVYKDNLQDWWDKNEYKNLSKQLDIFNNAPKPDFIEHYKFLDEYDDEFCEDQNDATPFTKHL